MQTKKINFKQDGDKVCATFEDFINLQESPAGFGDTEMEAMQNLYEVSSIILDIPTILNFIQKHVTDVKEGEMTCIESYRRLRGFKKAIEGAIKEIESDVIGEVEQNKQEYLDFSVSTRTTYNYKDSPLFLDKQSELKEIEKTLKVATDMHNKGDTYCDGDGAVVEPVGVKYTQVLTYKPRG